MSRELTRMLLIGVAALLAAFALWWVLTEPGRANRRAAEARGGQVVAEGEGRVIEDVGQARVDLNNRTRDRQDLGQETEDAIRELPGADAPVDPDLHDGAMRRICLRDSLRDHPDCVRLRQQDSARSAG